MESTPLYSPDEQGSDRRTRDSKERAGRSTTPESMFVDPRRSEPHPPLRPPLEAVVHIRPENNPHTGFLQQQAELAKDDDTDKKDERTTRPAPTSQPAVETEAPQSVAAPDKTPDYRRPDGMADADQLDEPTNEVDQSAPQSAENPAYTETDPDANNLTPVEATDPLWRHAPAATPSRQPAVEYGPLSPDVTDAHQDNVTTPTQSTPYAWPPTGVAARASFDADKTDASFPTAEFSSPTAEPSYNDPELNAGIMPTATAELPPELPDASQPATGEQFPWLNPSEQQPAYAANSTESTRSQPDDPYSAVNPLFGSGAPTASARSAVPPAAGGGFNLYPPQGPYEQSAAAAPSPSGNYNVYGRVTAQSSPSLLERFLPSREQHSHRGLVLGIIGGVVVANTLSKRRDNKLAERIDTLQQQYRQSEQRAATATQELQQTQATLRAEQQRTQQEIAKLRIQPQPEAVPAYAPIAETRADVSETVPYAAAPAAANAVPNRPIQPEQHQAAPIAPEQQPGLNPNQQQEVQNGIHLRPGEHIKQSAWHAYVEKDGHVVEGAIDYGQGFLQEQQQERLHVPQFDNPQGQAMPQDMYGQPVHPTLPSGMTTPSLPTGMPTHADPQHQLPDHTDTTGKGQIKSNLTNPWFWLMLGLIFAAFFITITV